MSVLFSYLNILRYNLVIELCHEQIRFSFFLWFLKTNLKLSRYWFFDFFNNALFHIYFSRELTILWLSKIRSYCKYGLYKTINNNIHPNIYYLYISEFRFYCNILYCIILPFYILKSQFIMGKDIGRIKKNSIPPTNFVNQGTC